MAVKIVHGSKNKMQRGSALTSTEWDEQHRCVQGRHWRMDKRMNCLVPVNRPCSDCSSVVACGFLCDACAERWCERYFANGIDLIVAAVASLNEPDVKRRGTQAWVRKANAQRRASI